MKYPAYVAEMGLPQNRGKIEAGVWAGYVIAAGFAVLAIAGAAFGVVGHGGAFALMLAIKLVLNTIVLVVLRRGGRVLELMALNMTVDVLLMTGAIYFTGGPASPLVAVYVIEVTVTALLSNVGVTLLTAGGILLAYVAMTVLVVAGVLPMTVHPGDHVPGAIDAVVASLFAAFAIGVPTFFTLRIVARLQDREAVAEARAAEVIEAGKQRSVFLASVTHELRTPIHGVQGLADLIASGVYGAPTDKQKDAAAAIKRSAQSLLHLVDDLLALVRADVGRLEVSAAPTDLREMVDQVVASVGWMLGTKKLTLATEVEGGEVVTDRRLVGHILVNLVANAAKFTREGGRVVVRASARDAELVLSVADNGIGIPPEKRAEIFEAFRQVDGSDERVYGGVGLGLALVARLVDLLGGKIELESEVGVGSTFRVSLPVSSEVRKFRSSEVLDSESRDRAPPVSERLNV